MTLSPEEFDEVLLECRQELLPSRVENVYQSDEHTVTLSMYRPGRGKVFLLFVTRDGVARLHLVVERPASLPRPASFCESARSHLKGLWLEAVNQGETARRVELHFRSQAHEGRKSTVATLHLKVAATGSHLVLLQAQAKGKPREVLAVLGTLTSRDRDPLTTASRGGTKPLPPPAADDASSAAADPLGETSLSVRLASRYAPLEVAVARDAEKETLLRMLRKERRRRKRTLERVREDLERAQAGEQQRVFGELLQASLAQVRRGMTSIEVVNYFDPELTRVSIELDPARSPRENIERLFKRYKKSKRAVPYIEQRLAQLEEEWRTLEEHAAGIEACETTETVRDLALRLRPLLRASRGRGAGPVDRKRGAPAVAPPRRFLSRGGDEILAGRNAKGNDRLSLRLARGNDIFLHVAGRPGAHVILRAVPGKQVAPLALEDAAQIALFYSLPARQRSQRDLDASADVDYTHVKYLHKPKGARPGLVYLKQHKTLRVRLDSGALERLMSSTEDDRNRDPSPGDS